MGLLRSVASLRKWDHRPGSGKVTAMGSYNEIIIQKPEIALRLQTNGEDGFQCRGLSELSLTSTERNAEIDEIEPTDNERNDHSRQQGSWSVYGYYFRSAGYILLLFFLGFATIEAFCTNFQSQCTLTSETYSTTNTSSSTMDAMVGGGEWRTIESTTRDVLGCVCHDLWTYLSSYCSGLLVRISLHWGTELDWWEVHRLLFVRILNNTSLNLHSDLLRSALGCVIYPNF